MKLPSHLSYDSLQNIILILFTIVPTASYSFPDLIRKGYTSCLSCHVSPAGGGALTSYGRGVSEELATFSYDGSGAFAGIPQLDSFKDPTGLFSYLKGNIQIEYRSVRTRVEREGQDALSLTIPMQESVEAALHLGKTTDIVASYGRYGPLRTEQSRVHYLQVRTSQYLQFRTGRFLPAYGLNIDDHTSWIRSTVGVSQGRESLNFEAHAEGERLSLTFTQTMGQDVTIRDSGADVTVRSEQRRAVIYRGTLKLWSRHYIGGSYWSDNDKVMWNLIAATSPIKDWLYFLGEYDEIRVKDLQPEKIFFLRSGSELYHGITVNYDLSQRETEVKKTTRHAFSIQLMPVPHVEFRLQAQKEDETMTYLIMSHLWL